MTDAEVSEVHAREEAKRQRMMDPTQRWKQIEEMLTWAEAQLPPHLQRNRPRVPSASGLPAS
jgi:hypothetical protein